MMPWIKRGHGFDFMESLKDFIQNQDLPPIGFDLQLRWFSDIHDGIYGNLTAKYGLDLDGKEGYLFVADRDTDIRDLAVRAMMGNNSYAGHIPVATAAFASAYIVRCVLYPAIIYANPGRDVTTTQLMNFPDGRTWTTNDGKSTPAYSSRAFKESFSSHGRFYEGHCVWDNLLERFNEGVSVWYYSGHGTGGSGISAQYSNVAEQFPYGRQKRRDGADSHGTTQRNQICMTSCTSSGLTNCLEICMVYGTYGCHVQHKHTWDQ